MNNPLKLRYIPNKLGVSFIYLYLIINTAYAIFFIDNLKVNLFLAFAILSNIALSLTMFLASTRIKKYDRNWLYILYGVVGYQLIRLVILWFQYDLANTLGFNLSLFLLVANLAGLGTLVAIIVISYYYMNARENAIKQLREVQNG